MKYIDNLIAWGDQLFRQRHDRVDQRGDAALRPGRRAARAAAPEHPAGARRAGEDATTSSQPQLDEFSNALVEIENLISIRAATGASRRRPRRCRTLHMLYFCIPPNDKLLGYWDTVADRLFKIRHCMNIEGVVAPAAAVRAADRPGAAGAAAAAAGVDMASVLADLNAPLPHYRFTTSCAEGARAVRRGQGARRRAAGGAGEADAEALALLRSTHEVAVLEAIRAVQRAADRRGRGAAARRSQTARASSSTAATTTRAASS